MLFHKQSTTSTEEKSIPFRFQWRELGELRVSAFTGFMEYAGKNQPRGQYLQADCKRWVHQSQFVQWVAQ